ncbi:MAG: hypothetical protein AAF610_00460 [Pseudomonadota bacterium]
MTQPVSTLIPMIAAEDQAEAFSDFLSNAARIVAETEPGTQRWFALRKDDQLAIFDTFTDDAARQTHFAGSVAAALKDNASSLVQGGWESGVLSGVQNGSVLFETQARSLETVTTGTYIALTAMPGRGDELAEFLVTGGQLVRDSEPATLYWAALRLDAERFAIFDVFADERGRNAHFGGQVAAALKQQASTLVKGGWQNGVLDNVAHYDVLAAK